MDATNGEFAHCPYPEGMGDSGYYLLHSHHQHQGLLQSKDVDECCFFKGHAKRWLRECDYFPENYFELWDIYEKYASKQSKKIAEKLHEQKDSLGRSVHAVQSFEKVHLNKDSLGRSVHAVKASEKAQQVLSREDRIINGIKGAEKSHSERDESGKSVLGVKNGERLHKNKDENGKSVNALRGNAVAHADKDENGKSVLGVKNGRRMHAEVWESTIDSFQGNAGNVAQHNRRNGWDPDARVKIS